MHTDSGAIWPLLRWGNLFHRHISQRTLSSAAIYMGGSQNPQSHPLPPSAVMGCFLKAQIFTACSFSLSSSNTTFISHALANRYMFHNHQVEIQEPRSSVHRLLSHRFHPTISDRSCHLHLIKLAKQRKDWNVDWVRSPDQSRSYSWKLVLSLMTEIPF